MAPKAKGHPSAEDLALWRKVARTVTPLKDRPNLPPPAKAALPAKPQAGAAPAARPPLRKPVSAQALSPQALDAQTLGGPLQAGCLAGIDRRTSDRFRRGRMEIDATLDLHGMTQERAQAALRRFLHQAAGRNQRCLLVITGKGRAESGVLRRAVPLWLNDADLRPIVLAISPAQPNHGGQGALYVLLRRRRDA
ncbi:MAG: Smr/MutS family protein [Rhodospirillales bacterium]|nr:Smr/MutS family protein [Rhodospirillales bacterium]